MFWSGSVYPWIKKRIGRVSSSLHWHGGPQEAVGVHTITIHTNPAVEDHKTQWLESLKHHSFNQLSTDCLQREVV